MVFHDVPRDDHEDENKEDYDVPNNDDIDEGNISVFKNTIFILFYEFFCDFSCERFI